MMNTPKVWFITGTSTGLGRELVKAVLDRGDNVVASARRLESIVDLQVGSKTQQNTTTTRSEKGKCSIITLDVTSPFTSIRETAAEAHAIWGRIDVLVLNAGAGMLGITEEVGVEGYQKQFDTNFFGPLNVTNAFLPYMRAARSGVIVFIGSRSSWRPNVLMLGTYAASKAALSAAAASLAVEVAPFGIRVVDICPGGLRTTNWVKMQLLPTSPNATLGTTSDSNAEICKERTANDTAEDRIADYSPFRQAHVDFMSTLSGTQPGDPVRAATVIINIVRAEGPFEGCEDPVAKARQGGQNGSGGASANPWAKAVAANAEGGIVNTAKILPGFLVLGSDSQRDVKTRCESVLQNLDEWKDVGQSIDFQ